MKNRYEGLMILNVKGNEDSAKEIIERIEGELKKEGANIEQVQRLERRHFSYAAGALDSGYYVNVIFHAEPKAVERVKTKLTLDANIYRQHYVKLRAKKAAPARA